MAAVAKSGGYTAAGVNIDLADELLERVKPKLALASRPEVLGGVGGFGGLFQLDLSRHKQPVLVASTDGVGTKLMVAQMMDQHRSVGHDIVNHCVNDIAVQGAEPLFFLDYIGLGRLRSPLYEEVLTGIAEACQAQGCAVLGGETAEMPGMYGEHYDLVGTIIGVVDRSRLITGEKLRPGHVAIALPSNGLHTNGYSLARRALFDAAKLTAHTWVARLGESVGEALLKPHTCYWPAIKAAMAADLPLDGIAHITGGGVYENIPRILPAGLDVVLDARELPMPPIFRLIAEHAATEPAELYRVFNMGIGMVWFVPPASAKAALDICHHAGLPAQVCGEITTGTGVVKLRGIDC